MQIGLLEYSQNLSDKPRLITRAKAARLVGEFKVAVHRTPYLIQLTIQKSWSVVKGWLRGTLEQVQSSQRGADAQTEKAQQVQARAKHPHGSLLNFGRWPSKDQRTL
jgi:hypothetical protein